MSRTYRHITKSGKKNAYAMKMFMQWFDVVSYYETKEERIENFKSQYHRDGHRHNASKSFRKSLNNEKRNKLKQQIIRNLKNDTFDNMPSQKWYKDANYLYW